MMATIQATRCALPAPSAARLSARRAGLAGSKLPARMSSVARAVPPRAPVSARSEASRSSAPAPVAAAAATVASLVAAAPAFAEDAASGGAEGAVLIFAQVLKYGSLAVFLYSIVGMAGTMLEVQKMKNNQSDEDKFFDQQRGAGIAKGAMEKMKDEE